MPDPTSVPYFELCYLGAAIFYGAYLLAELVNVARRWLPLAVGVGLHLLGLVQRARVIDFFPLSNKFESFYGFALAVTVVVLIIQASPSRIHRLATFAVGATFYLATLLFERHASFPPPLMQTIWYPLHVPASFLSYALWVSSAAAGLAILVGPTASGAGPTGGGLSGGDEPALRTAVDGHAFWGWCVFSVSMVFGGMWGYVAWGAYFLWDPKVIWSVILWLFYSGFVHLRFWPAGNRPRNKSALALVGMLIMLVAYVGTSFLFGHGSHSFG